MRPYQKVYGIEKIESKGVLEGNIIVEEKLDGKQFRIEISKNGVRCGSHKVDDINEGDKQFKLGIQKAKEVFKPLSDWLADANSDQVFNVYAEYMPCLTSNAVAYKRVPSNNLVVFDVYTNDKYLTYDEKNDFAKSWHLECIYKMWEGNGKDFTKEKAEELLKQESPLLGNNPDHHYKTVEGIVIKNYGKYYDSIRFPWLSGMFMCSKWVNEPFQELNKAANPSNKNSVDNLIEMYKANEARFRKAIQHLEEEGKLANEMKDLAILIPAVKDDIVEEDKENIKDALWKIFSSKILGVSVLGFPEFYKKYLIDKSGNI